MRTGRGEKLISERYIFLRPRWTGITAIFIDHNDNLLRNMPASN